jgi:uncharacterized membrane protein YkvA (DUF1232 family)
MSAAPYTDNHSPSLLTVSIARISGFLKTLSVRAQEIFSIAGRSWGDPRVPVLAKILVLTAPLYWLNPFDLVPDLQPGGYCDDLLVSCLLAWAVFRLIPREVIKDARISVHKAARPAVCGLCFVSLFWLVLGCVALGDSTTRRTVQAQPSNSTDSRSQSYGKIPHSIERFTVNHGFISNTACRSINGHVLTNYAQAANKAFNTRTPNFVLRADLPASNSILVCASTAAQALRTAPSFVVSWFEANLLLRGGQAQHYALDDSADARSCEPFISYDVMPSPKLAGGIFVCISAKISLSETVHVA